MMDALGFKELSLRHPVPLREKMHGLVKGMFWLGRVGETLRKKDPTIRAEPQVTFLSDTVVVGIPIMSDPDFPSSASEAAAHDDAHTLALAAAATGEIILRAGEGPHPMAYRGCISFGEYEMDPPFILGPAVNDAAEHYELAECAAVWLSPKALSVWNKAAATLQDSHAATLHPHSVPLKSGSCFESLVVNPFAERGMARMERHGWLTAVLGSFQGPISVHVKRQNTEKLFTLLHEAAGTRLRD